MRPASIALSLVVALGLVAPSLGAYNALALATQCCDCIDLEPRNVPPNVQPQTKPSPFRIIVNHTRYRPREEVLVEIVSEKGYSFRSFMLKAVRVQTEPGRPVSKTAVGVFSVLSPNIGTIPDCQSLEGGYALKSTIMDPKTYVKLVWVSEQPVGHLQILGTFVVDDDTFWVRERSSYINDPDQPPLPVSPKPPVLIPFISTSDCGISKGCYREPEGCWEPNCEYIVTWREESYSRPEENILNVPAVRFEIGGYTDGLDDRYVAVGLSEDIYMGDDSVMECVHNSEDSKTEVLLSYNREENRNERLSEPKADILHQEGSYHNGRLRCRFWMRKYASQRSRSFFPLTGKASHLLLARGEAVQGVKQRHGMTVGDLPAASPLMVNFQRNIDFGGRARYPLVKAHGCLMLLAWVFFASLGLLLTKYYKPMWPNRRLFGQKYWFVGHFNCMATVFVLVIIAFILIFIEAGGYSKAPDLPQKAHPILGIIIFVCIIINPIIALIRPPEDDKCRPVFNWFHWAFGTIANVLAIPNIFIGLDFGKAHVPWWATWILVIWVIFHLIVEVTLEVHQCCMHKKNKERRKKWELQKRENPKLVIPEPEPAGRRFKRFMLMLHFIVTAIVTLIMVIIIAVA